ncbi:MAG: hypothetical protein JSU72_17375 [Deltaproteobacteria bacterium]|nr:MAG: hypothetical protein JSU72_17375 [Deltaproteobacteria bacterium]
MDDRQANPQQRHSVDFLLAEYQSHRDAFWHNEELGESRLNFFVTLTTAVIAALAVRERGFLVSGGEVDPIFFYGLGAVLLFGVVTLVRIIRRNLVSHEYLRANARIRRYFTDRDQEILRHLYYKPWDDRPQRKKEWNQIFSLGTGGLVETIALVNSLIVAALCALFTRSYPGWMIGLLALVGFIAAWIVQFIYVKYRYDIGRPKKGEIEFPGD